VPSGVERAFSEEPSANVRGHAWGNGTGVRCAGARSGEAPVLEAAAQVPPRWFMAPSTDACAARILAAAASPAPAFACAVFLGTCMFGDAAVDEGGESGCCSCQEGNWRQICPLAHPPPAHSHGEGCAVSYGACASVVLDGFPPRYLSQLPSRARSRAAPRRSAWRIRGHLRGIRTAAGDIFAGTRTPWASRRRLADACDDSGRPRLRALPRGVLL
jgi:hypothetical protein